MEKALSFWVSLCVHARAWHVFVCVFLKEQFMTLKSEFGKLVATGPQRQSNTRKMTEGPVKL